MSRTENRIAVLIVDDDSLARQALASYLENVPDIVVRGVCQNGEEALLAQAAYPADVILMDISMPRMNGIETTRRLVKRWPSARVILMTTVDSDLAVPSLTAGGCAFLLKHTSPDALISSIRIARYGGHVISSEAAHNIVTRYLPSTRSPQADLGLSPREFDILHLLCQAMSNATIASTLHLSESTVKAYVSSVMAKLGCSSRLKVVVRSYELGIQRHGRNDTTGA